MNRQHTAKLGVSLILLCLISLGMGCKKDMPREITNLQSCNRPPVNRPNFVSNREYTLFRGNLLMRESDMLSKKHAIYVSTTNGTILSSSGDGKSYSIICNFPNSAKRWKIPKQGLKVIISGQYYPYDGIVPTDRTRAYLELTSLKIANE